MSRQRSSPEFLRTARQLTLALMLVLASWLSLELGLPRELVAISAVLAIGLAAAGAGRTIRQHLSP